MDAITRKRVAASKKRSSVKDKKNCTNPEYNWNELDLGTPHDIAQAAYDDSVTSIVVTDAKMFTVQDIIFVRSTEEQMLVQGVNAATNTLTVERGFAGTTAAAIPNGEVLILQGSAFAEGSRSPKAMAFKPGEESNYCQIFKQAIQNSRTGLQTNEYAGQNSIVNMRINAFDVYNQKKARQYYFGKKSLSYDSEGNPVRTTNGINEMIVSNLIDLTGGMTYSGLMDAMELIMMFGGEERVLFSSSKLLKAIQLCVLGDTQYPISPKSKEFGIDIKRINTAFGDLHIAHDRTLDYYCGSGGVTGMGFALELANVEEMVMESDSWHDNVQEKDRDGRKDQIIGESGLKLMLEQRHAKIII